MELARLHLGKKPDLLHFRVQSGKMQTKDGRWQTYGLHDGASDIVCVLAPAGRWVAMEFKSINGKLKPEQSAFLELIEKFGGYACVPLTLASVEAHYIAAGGRYHGDPEK